MKVTLVYVYHPGAKLEYVEKFLRSYVKSKMTHEHSCVVAVNGGPVTGEIQMMFSPLTDVSFYEHDNSGYDIGAFQAVARHVPSDIMIFCGESAYFNRPDWLSRVLYSVSRYGEGVYGTMGNAGDLKVNVYPHIRTTGFWTSTNLMNRYPVIVDTPEKRYPFEHGENCFTQWVIQQGLPALIVAEQLEYKPGTWDDIPNGFHRGNQSNLLIRDRLSDPPYYTNK